MALRITVFSTTHCPYCLAAKRLLRAKGLEFEEINLDEDPQRWTECEERSKQRTVPQIFIGEIHVGGCDDLKTLDRSGELDRLLEGL